MKVLYICSDAGVPVLGRKGASVHVRALVAAFNRAGHQVVLAAPLLNKSPWEEPENLEALLVHIKPSSSLQTAVSGFRQFCQLLQVQSSMPGELRRVLYNQEMIADLERRFENDPPDFIYERAALYGMAGVSLSQKLKVPLILELNAPLTLEQTAYRGSGLQELAAQAELCLLKQAGAVLTVSNQLREHVLALGVPPEHVQVCPNGVDPSLFCPGPRNPTLRAQFGLDIGPVLGFVGGLRPWHGVEILPGLLARLSSKHPRVRLIVAGDGPLRAPLEQEFQKCGLSERVVFTGAVSHEKVASLIREFDVALAPYPPLEHDFYFSPLKLFEYMACGIPVVAANLGQISEMVTDGQTGLLYPAGDLEALSDACERLLSDPKLRLSLGTAAAQLVHRQFTWDCNASRVAALAQSLIAARKNKQEPPQS